MRLLEHVLGDTCAGNYGPVPEEREEAGLKVVGNLPEDLDGVFVRIGPNPALQPVGDYHCECCPIIH